MRVTFVHGPQRATQDRSCSASKAATTALVVATRAAVDRCGPGNVVAPLLTRTEEGQGQGGGQRVALHGQGPEESPAGALQPVRRRARRGAACQPGRAAGAAGAGTATPQMVDQLVIKHVDSVVPEQIIAVPTSRFPRTALREPQKAEQLVEVPVLVPSFSDWVRWEETCRRTGHTWLGGFDWRLTASPGRYFNTGQGPRRRPWYRAASVPVHRQSGGNPCLRLSPQLRTVQTVQFCGVRGELQRQVPAVPRRLWMSLCSCSEDVPGCAVHSWTVDTKILHQQGRLLEEFLIST